MAGLGDFAGPDGFGECDDESEEVFAGIGIMESADVVGGLDSLRRGLEIVRRIRDWDF